MIQQNTLEFMSKFCKQRCHIKCHGSWAGLGFITECNCVCHRKKDKALAGLERPEAGAFTVS